MVELLLLQRLHTEKLEEQRRDAEFLRSCGICPIAPDTNEAANVEPSAEPGVTPAESMDELVAGLVAYNKARFPNFFNPEVEE